MKKLYSLIAVVAALLVFAMTYLLLTPLNLHAGRLWLGILLLCLLSVIAPLAKAENGAKSKRPVGFIASLSVTLIVLAIMVFGGIGGATIFHAKGYASMMSVTETDISDYTISINDVPLIDRDSAYLLANRKMGTLVDLVSQFELSEDVNTQINYRGRPTRVVPIAYAGLFKYLANRDSGTPGYIIVDMQTQEAELVNVPGGLNYVPSAFWGKDLMRHIYSRYPTRLLGNYCFEIDDEGNPFWVVRAVDKTIGLFGGSELHSIILVNAVTGETVEYLPNDIPAWIDNAYWAQLLINQYDYHGTLSGGWLNSHIGQKNVVETTDGYNYIAFDDDIYMYTGVTSVVSDESNIGFIFSNLRTKETIQYTCPSAEEYSAMASAEGLVQHLGYTSTFPILVNVAGEPTYCMTLKDAGGLIKQYGMVNATQYQVVVTAATLSDTISAYIKALDDNNIPHSGQAVDTSDPAKDNSSLTEISGKVSEIRSATINGTTYYYLKLDGTEPMFEVSAEYRQVILLNVGDTVTLYYDPDMPLLSERLFSARME